MNALAVERLLTLLFIMASFFFLTIFLSIQQLARAHQKRREMKMSATKLNNLFNYLCLNTDESWVLAFTLNSAVRMIFNILWISVVKLQMENVNWGSLVVNKKLKRASFYVTVMPSLVFFNKSLASCVEKSRGFCDITTEWKLVLGLSINSVTH